MSGFIERDTSLLWLRTRMNNGEEMRGGTESLVRQHMKRMKIDMPPIFQIQLKCMR